MTVQDRGSFELAIKSMDRDAAEMNRDYRALADVGAVGFEVSGDKIAIHRAKK